MGRNRHPIGANPSKIALDGHHLEPKPEPAARPARKKYTVGTRSWMVIDSTGHAGIIEAGKHSIMKRAGLPAGDLRILDPLLSDYSSSILGRERAVVVNLEHIKAIVTAHEVLLLNFKDPKVDPFVSDLQRRIQIHHGLNEARMDGCIEGEKANVKKVKNLPFEFVALEACLESVCSCLEIEATALEKEAYPALDKLTSSISTLNLGHVRQIKSRLVGITGRVQKVRGELEHLLDDDDDMAEMYLTDKLTMRYASTGSSSRSLNEDDMDDKGHLAEISSEEIYKNNNCEVKSDTGENHEHIMSKLKFNEDGRGTRTCSMRSGREHSNTDELEMLVKAYFVQICSTLNNLSELREYVDDTEDCINIMLDEKQNQILQMGVVLNTATVVVTAFVLLTGIFGMNIKTDFVDANRPMTSDFWWIVGGGTVASLFMYVLAIAWYKHEQLIE